MLGTTLEAKDSPEGFGVLLWELPTVSCVEGPRHAPVQQGLNHLGLEQEDLWAEPGARDVVMLWTTPLVACPHESDPSLDLNHEASVFVDNAAEVWKLRCLSVPLSCCFDDERRTPGKQGPVFVPAWSPPFRPKP